MNTKLLQSTVLILSALVPTAFCESAQAAYSAAIPNIEGSPLHAYFQQAINGFDINYADLQFQLSQDESTVFELIFKYYLTAISNRDRCFNDNHPEAIENRKEKILELIGPDHFLNYSIQFLEGDTQLQFIQWAIQKGANINHKITDTNSQDLNNQPLDLALEKALNLKSKKSVCDDHDIQLVQSLIHQGAKCAELNDINIQVFTENGLGYFLQNPKAIIQAKYQHLNAQPGKEARMPYTLHHIWLTHPDSPTEIPLSHLNEALNTKALFEGSEAPWTHILWTNAEALIPESVAALKAAGIEVKSIHDCKTNLRNYEKVIDLIENKLWGMASDILRYNLIHHFGGVYADLNFVFNRDVTHEAHTYDYFSITYDKYFQDNFFFGAKANHPVMEALVEFFEKPDPSYLDSIRNDKQALTDVKTAYPLSIIYYKAANLNGTIDVVYPEAPDEEEAFDADEDLLMTLQKIGMHLIEQACPDLTTDILLCNELLKDEVCATAQQNIGDDSQTDSLSWMKSDEDL